MSATAFDTLQFTKKLKAVKMPQEQAEVVAEALRESFDERDKALIAVEARVRELAADTRQMATREDIFKLEIAIKDLFIKLGGTIGAAVAVILAAMRWMPHG